MGEWPNKATQFKPGQSGNPAGRPPGRGLTDKLRTALESDDGKAAKKLIQVVMEAALAGDVKFVQMVWDRMEGRAVMTIDGEVEKTVRIVHERGEGDDTDASSVAADREVVADILAKRAGHNGSNGSAGRQNGTRRGSSS